MIRSLLLVALLLLPRAVAADTSEALSRLSSHLATNWRAAEDLRVTCAEPREGPWCWATFWIGERERFEAVMCRAPTQPWAYRDACISMSLWADQIAAGGRR